MASHQFCVRIPLELDSRLAAYALESRTTKTKVMVDALAHYLGCADDVPLIRRVVELEERIAALEALNETSLSSN
jgi:predicted DNA-binding protein